MEIKLVLLRGHHAMASSDDDATKIGSGSSRLLWRSFWGVQTARPSESCTGMDCDPRDTWRGRTTIYKTPRRGRASLTFRLVLTRRWQ